MVWLIRPYAIFHIGLQTFSYLAHNWYNTSYNSASDALDQAKIETISCDVNLNPSSVIKKVTLWRLYRLIRHRWRRRERDERWAAAPSRSSPVRKSSVVGSECRRRHLGEVGLLRRIDRKNDHCPIRSDFVSDWHRKWDYEHCLFMTKKFLKTVHKRMTKKQHRCCCSLTVHLTKSSTVQEPFF